MLNAQLLHKLKEKHPKYTEEQIKFIIKSKYSKYIFKIKISKIFKVTIPLIGVFKTHGNKKSKFMEMKNINNQKYLKKIDKHTDEQLLF